LFLRSDTAIMSVKSFINRIRIEMATIGEGLQTEIH